jgi:hypothetical protein
MADIAARLERIEARLDQVASGPAAGDEPPPDQADPPPVLEPPAPRP